MLELERPFTAALTKTYLTIVPYLLAKYRHLGGVERLQIIDTLRHLSLAVSDIGDDDVKRVANAISTRVCNATKASLVKLYWKESAVRGMILSPIDFINKTNSPNPLKFQVDERPGGILSWVVHNRRTLWLEEIQLISGKDQPLKGRAIRQQPPPVIDPAYDDFRNGPPLQSMVTVPLFNEHGELSGLYSVEFLRSGVITPDLVEIVEMLGKSLARLLWECEVTSRNLYNTREAVDQFVGSATITPFPLALDCKTCFIARPFKPEYERVEQIVSASLRQKEIRARSYRPGLGQTVMEEVITQIRESHFGIVDITGANPNVMAELGMMMALPREMLLLRRRGDDTAAPFDIAHLPIYDYEVDAAREELLVYVPARAVPQSFESVLANFLESLPPEAGFGSARGWQGD